MREDNIIIDCFCGGGGASVGIEMALGRPVDIAINHDPAALLLHRTNHPNTLHLEEDIFQVDLKKYVGNGHVALMHASPACTHFSKARGSKPVEKQLRILSWSVYKHASILEPDVIIMENVEEIETWGPLNEEGYPIKERMGEDFQWFISAMRDFLGYDVEYRSICAADYGAPTTRTRWFCIMRRDGRPIVWPEPTHNKLGTDGKKPWEPCYKYLELDNWGNSIFMRGHEYGNKLKPLADNTMKRIAAGMEKFVFNDPNPFMVQVNHSGERFRGQKLTEPLPTISTKHGFGVVTPIITQYHSFKSDKVRGHKLSDPLMTIDTNPRYALVSAFLSKFYKTGIGQNMFSPLATITTSPGHFGQVTVSAVKWEDLKKNGIDEKTAKKCDCVSQFIMEYYKSGIGQSLYNPLLTVPCHDRFALITVLGNEYCITDIYLRMLSAEELKLCQGFPEDYIIDHDYKWNSYPIKERVAKIGNSVCPMVEKAIVEVNCPYLIEGERKPLLNINTDESGQLQFAV